VSAKQISEPETDPKQLETNVTGWLPLFRWSIRLGVGLSQVQL